MKRKHPVSKNDNATKLNRIRPTTNVLFNLLFLILALSCLLPVIFIFVISITDEQVVRTQGYQFYVTAKTISASAYKYLWTQRATILHSLWISIEVTVIGTALGVMLTSLMGYVLSRREHKLHGFLTIDNAMVIAESKVHHGTNNNLAVFCDRARRDGMHPKNGRLRRVNDWR